MKTPRSLGKTIGLVCGINLGLVLIYTLILMVAIPGNQHDSLGFALMMAFTVVLHAFLCLVAGIVFMIKGQRDFVEPFILAALAVAIVGFSTCYGGAEFMTGRGL